MLDYDQCVDESGNYVFCADGEWTDSEYLEAFSIWAKKFSDDFCLAYVFTHREFKSVGMSKMASPQPTSMFSLFLSFLIELVSNFVKLERLCGGSMWN